MPRGIKKLVILRIRNHIVLLLQRSCLHADQFGLEIGFLVLGWCLCVMACACAITTLLGDTVSGCFSFLDSKNILWSCKVEILFFKWGLKRCLSGPISKGKPALFAQQDGYLTNSFLPKGTWGGGVRVHSLCQIGFWFCIFISECVSLALFLVHGTTPCDFSVKTIKNPWAYFLILSILANNSSQFSYTELPFTIVVRPKISFKLCFIINWIYQGRLTYSDEIWSMAASQ